MSKDLKQKALSKLKSVQCSQESVQVLTTVNAVEPNGLPI